jgi:hypothetical protein
MKANFSDLDVAVAVCEAILDGNRPVTIKANKIPKDAHYPNMGTIGQRIRRKAFKAGTDGFSMAYPKNDLLSKFNHHKSIGHY